MEHNEKQLNPEAPEFHPSVQPQLPQFPTSLSANTYPQEEYIIVSNLPYSMTRDKIIEFFQVNVGIVKSCFFVDQPPDGFSGKVKITFSNPTDARKALVGLQQVKLRGRPMRIKLFVNECRTYPDQVAFIEASDDNEYIRVFNVRRTARPIQLIKHFEKFVGPVKSLSLERGANKIFGNKNTSVFKLVFHEPSDARKAAVSTHISFFKGQRIIIQLFIDSRLVPVDQQPNYSRWMTGASVQTMDQTFPNDGFQDDTDLLTQGNADSEEHPTNPQGGSYSLNTPPFSPSADNTNKVFLKTNEDIFQPKKDDPPQASDVPWWTADPNDNYLDH